MGVRLVIVDDSPFIRSALREIAESCGYDVVAEAGDGGEAVAFVNRNLDDREFILLLDVSMPIMGGFAAARAIARDHVRFIFVSQHDDPAYAEEGLRLGARGYLLKSSIVRELKAAIEAVLEGHIYISPSIRLSEAAYENLAKNSGKPLSNQRS